MKYEKIITENINGINLVIAKMPDNTLRLLHLHPYEFDEAALENEPEQLK